MSRREDIRQLIVTLNRRLQKLKEQQALYGPSIDPAVLIQIEDTETELQKLQAELAELNEVYQAAPPVPPPMLASTPPVTVPPHRDNNFYGILVGGSLIIVLLLVGIVWFFATNGSGLVSATATHAIILLPTPPPVETLTPTPSPTSAKLEPEFGEITFARGVTQGEAPQTYVPISPASCFSEGITEIHAIFEYNGMSTEYSWEKVIYQDELERLRKSSRWTLGESSVFDYVIDAGGNPLPSGQWRLELYVNGKLLREGSFRIKQACSG